MGGRPSQKQQKEQLGYIDRLVVTLQEIHDIQRLGFHTGRDPSVDLNNKAGHHYKNLNHRSGDQVPVTGHVECRGMGCGRGEK